MKYAKIDPAKSQAGQVSKHREPYEPPTVTVVPLKIEERLLSCSKQTATICSPPRLS